MKFLMPLYLVDKLTKFRKLDLDQLNPHTA